RSVELWAKLLESFVQLRRTNWIAPTRKMRLTEAGTI
ncbi:uncharacterized protein METZ01_LOCUS141683, partial [marine metagenome]